MALVKHVWKQRDNSFVLKFESIDIDGLVETVDMALVTKILLELENAQYVVVNKDDPDGSPIDWWHPDLAAGEASFALGDWTQDNGVADGVHRVRLTLFSLDKPDGIVWTSYAKGEQSISVHATADIPTL